MSPRWRARLGGGLSMLVVWAAAGCGAGATSAVPSPTPLPAGPTVTSGWTPSPSPSTAPASPRPSPSASPQPSPPFESPTRPPIPPSLLGTQWYRLPTTRRVVALTFDAGANADGAPAILAALSAANAPATFFLTGRWAEAYPGTAAPGSGSGTRSAITRTRTPISRR